MEPHAALVLLRSMADAVDAIVKKTPPQEFGREVRMGADGTATKHVDDIAEREILDILRAGPHKLNLLSEEAGFVDFGGDSVLVADPIDGTTNAVRGIPFYCISLAVGTEVLSDVTVGLVQNLCTGDRYEAIRGEGATLNGHPIRVAPPKRGALVAMGLGAGKHPELDRAPGAVRSFGASALEMSLVGSGALDAYHYETPILRIIDIAAATLIVREAGGVVLDAKGDDLELPLTLTPRFGLTTASTRDGARRLIGGLA